MRFAFIVLHFRDSAMSERCVASVTRCADPQDTVIVVDNSHDFSPVTVKPLVVRPPDFNPGFAAGMNAGAKEAQKRECDILVFVNNDTMLEENFRTEVASAFVDSGEGLAAVGPKVVFSGNPEIVQTAGGYISPRRMGCVHTGTMQPATSIRGRFETTFISGCVIAVRSSAFTHIGGWSEAYFFGGEDMELSLRLTRSGYRLAICADTTVFHDAKMEDGSGSSHSYHEPFFFANLWLNRILFASRNFTPFENFRFRVFLFMYFLVMLPVRLPQIGAESGYFKKLSACTRSATRLPFIRKIKSVDRELVERLAKEISR
ncbi:MAG: glycosyltransferase family 2 protein [Nitrospirota bacterium]|nr:glycosyltransferase family 2 protein [Nitrospirota bacterium]